MKRAADLFDAPAKERVRAAVAAAEQTTSCELVPVVATSSGRYDRAEDVVGLWLACGAAVVVWLLWPHAVASGDWDAPAAWVGPAALVAAIAVSFTLGAWLATRIGWLRRPFIPADQAADEVNAAARRAFFDRRVHHTGGATGVLFYVSLYEHRAAVLADRAVVEALGEGFTCEVCAVLTKGLKDGAPADALCAAIAEAARRLAPVLPRAEDDRDELSNALVLLEEPGR
ncbi:hypothetical protein [Alienimonas chondri]|uniref:TPM domain-containing protein n=1 Tax=Alienimonas chondri TaxID=2681879 RepID=A0ABX1VBJ2_9PLAN|nr:hypothetical protein [Alienimonas chondri]NNJ25482.1 hypothetical protein [Alienimonas chondri]